MKMKSVCFMTTNNQSVYWQGFLMMFSLICSCNAALGVTMFAEKSTSEDWLKRAEEMMERRLYEVAAKCFRMGKDDAKSKLALALNQELTALRSTDNVKQVKVEFICAAERLLDCSEDKRAVQCLQKAHEFELAGLLYEKCGMVSMSSTYPKVHNRNTF